MGDACYRWLQPLPPGPDPDAGHPPCENQTPFQPPECHPMDIEQVNAIGTLLADLSARTEQLRGYL